MSREQNSKRLREALIQAGMKHIATYGYHGTGIKQVLDEVQVPKGSFYNFFKSKEDFVAEVIMSYGEQLTTRINHFFETDGKHLSLEQQLVAIIDISLNHLEENQYSCILSALATEVSVHSDTCRRALQQVTQDCQQLLIKQINQTLVSSDTHLDWSTEHFVHLYWILWQGALTTAPVDQSTKIARQTIRQSLQQLLPKPSAE